MANPAQPFAQPMAWWGAIAGSVRARATTAEVWSAIRAFGQANSLAYPPGMFQEVNRMRSQATGLRVATGHLSLALNSDAITTSMIGLLPYSRPTTSRTLVREFYARVNYEAVRAGQLEQGYITIAYTGALPATVGQLRDDAEGIAEGLVLASGTHSGGADAFVGVGAIELGEY